MSEDRKVNIVVAAENQTKGTFQEIKTDAASAGAAVEQAGTQAASGLGRMGSAAGKAAEKLAGAGKEASQTAGSLGGLGTGADAAGQGVDRASRSIIASIQRATAELEAGKKNTASYYEAIARQRGVGSDVLEPYLAQLRKAEAAQRNMSYTAAQSAAQTAAAMRQVPAQFTDIVVSLQGGMNPLTVFLQQGGQLKDMFGGAGAAARALGGYVAGLINPFTLAAAGAASLGAAYYYGSKENDAFMRAIVTTGNASGVTSSQLRDYARQIDAVVGTEAKASEALAEFTAAGVRGGDQLKQYAQSAIEWERVTGQAVAKTAEQFINLQKEPLQAVIKLNDGTNFLTASVYDQIKSLEQQGRHVDASKVAMNAYADAVSQRAKVIEQNLGSIERGWRGIKSAAKEAIDAVLNIGRKDTPADELSRVQRLIENKSSGLNSYKDTKAGKIVQKEIDDLKDVEKALLSKIAVEEQAAKTSANSARLTKAKIEFDETYEKALKKEIPLTDQLAAARRRGAEAGKSEAEIKNVLTYITEEYNKAHKKSDTSARFQQTADNELAALKTKLSTAKELGAQLRGQLDADGTGAVYSKQTEGEKEAATWLAKANVQRDQKVKALMLEKSALAQQRGEQEKANKAMEDAIAVQQKQVASVQQRIQSLTKEAENLEAANAVYGKSEAAIEALNAQRAQDAVGIAMSLGDSQQLIDQLTEEWKATVRLNTAKAESRNKKSDEALDAGIVAAKAQAALYEDEYRLIGMSAVERAKIVALRKVEVDLAKELDKIDRSGLDDPEKAKQRAKAEEKAQIERSMAVNKVLQDDFFHTSGQIETSLTDALMRGFGRGSSFAQSLADEAERVFESMVLRPTFAAASRPVAGAITNAIGSFGNPGQAGSGILGSVASSAIGTAITSGFAEVAAGYSGATLAAGLAGPTTAGATGLMGVGNMLAAVPGWGWALAGAAALMASGVGGSIGEVHSGGIYSTSSPANMTTAMRVTQNDSAAARDLVDRANEAVSKPLEKVGKGLVKTFDDLAKMLGTASDQFDLTLGFAADLSGQSKDKSAFGYFDLTDKATGETLAAYKNRNLGENSSEAMTKLTNDAARAMLDALAKADIPAWAEHALAKLGDVEGLDALAQFAAWPKTLLTQFGSDRDALVQKFAEGLATTDAATAGQNVALSLVSSIEQTVMTAGAGQIFDTVNVGIITPMLDALAMGASVSEALSQSSIDAVVQKATAQAQALNALFANVDFKAALDQIKTTVGTALGSAGAAMNYQPTYWKPDVNKAKEEQSAAEKAAEDLAKRIKDALNGLKTDGLSLQIELLRAQGNDASASLMELNKATEDWDAANRELYRQRLADNAALKEQIRAQQNLNALHSDAGTLAIELLRAQGNESAALRAERDLAIKGWTDLEIAQYDVNAATRAQIQATTDLKAAMEALVGTADNVAEKFLSPDMLGQYRVQRIADQLNNPALGIGVNFSAQALQAIGIDDLKTVVLDFVRSDAAPQAKNAVLQFGASLLDLKLQAQAAADAVAATRTGADIKLLQAQGDAQGALTLQRELDTRGMTAAQVAAYDYAHAIDQQITAMQEATAVAATRTGADIKLLQAQGDAQAALALQRELDTRGMTAAQVAAYDYAHAIDQQITAMQEATAVAATRTGADIKLLQAQGDVQGALALQRELDTRGMTAAQVAAYDYARAIDQQVTVMQQRQGLEQSIAQALGQTALLRERELTALDASNRPLQMRLYALTDAAAGMDAAMSGMQRAVDANKAQINKSAAAQIEALRNGIDTGAKSITEAQNQVNTLSGLFDTIADAVKSLRGNVNQELDLLQARSYIDMSLSLAQAGTLPDAKKLQDAISVVFADSADQYTTVADFEFAQLVQAGKLEKLGVLVDAQKSVQELQLDSLTNANQLAQDQITAIETARNAQLDALDQQLKNAQDQISVARGIDISVQSVDAAVSGVNIAVLGFASATEQASAAQMGMLDAQLQASQEHISVARNIDIGVQSIVSSMSILNASIASLKAAQASAVSSGGGGGGSYATATPGSNATAKTGVDPDAIFGTNGAQYDPSRGVGYQANTGMIWFASEMAKEASAMLAAGQDQAVIDAIKSQGFDHAQAEKIFGIDLPKFATGGFHSGGLRLVGERGMEIEATGPARYWNAADTQQFLGGGGGTSARLEQLFEQLLVRIEALEQQGVDAQKARDDLHDLLDKVTEGGNAIRTDLVAISEEKLEKWLTTSTQ